MRLWELRRCAIAEPDWSDEIKVSALVILDHIDWNTGEKELVGGRPHLYNWLSYIGETYDRTPEQMSSAFKKMIDGGYLMVSGKKLVTCHLEVEVRI